MKLNRILQSALVVAAALTLNPEASAQTSVTTTTAGGGTAVISTTTRGGRVSTVTPDMLVLESASGAEPIPYSRTTRTVFVDETGAAVPAELVKSGVPVTVHFTRDADRMVADRVIVQRQTVITPAPTVVERVVTPAPTVVERVVTPAPTVVERTVTRPVVVEKPVIVTPRVIEKKTTTTTTTAPVKVKKVDDDEDDD